MKNSLAWGFASATFACLVSAVLSVPALARSAPTPATPMLEKSVLFRSGEAGYGLYRIPGIVVTSKGTVLAYCEARRKGGDWDTINIMMRRSTDGGKTWDLPRMVAHQGQRVPRSPVAIEKKQGSDNDQTVNNAVAIADKKSGVVHFVYCVEYGHVFYMRSDDGGVSWSAPADLTPVLETVRPAYNWRVCAAGPGHGIQLNNNRLLVPVWLSTSDGSKNGHGPSCTTTLYSDDDGATWKAGAIVANTTAEWNSPGEPMAVELADGQVLMNMRNGSKHDRRLVSTSPDGAANWSTPHFDNALLEPNCMASMVRLSLADTGGKNRILFSNPDTLDARPNTDGAPGTGRDRKNLSVKMSYNEGKTWAVNRVLEAGPSAYSDLAVLPDGSILCLYECGTAKPYETLTLAHFNLAWLSGGKDTDVRKTAAH